MNDKEQNQKFFKKNIKGIWGDSIDLSGKLKEYNKETIFQELFEFLEIYKKTTKTSIRYLNLNNNNITSEEAMLILDVMKYENISVYQIKLEEGNDVEKAIVQEIEKYAQENHESEKKAMERIEKNELTRIITLKNELKEKKQKIIKLEEEKEKQTKRANEMEEASSTYLKDSNLQKILKKAQENKISILEQEISELKVRVDFLEEEKKEGEKEKEERMKEIKILKEEKIKFEEEKQVFEEEKVFWGLEKENLEKEVLFFKGGRRVSVDVDPYKEKGEGEKELFLLRNEKRGFEEERKKWSVEKENMMKEIKELKEKIKVGVGGDKSTENTNLIRKSISNEDTNKQNAQKEEFTKLQIKYNNVLKENNALKLKEKNLLEHKKNEDLELEEKIKKVGISMRKLKEEVEFKDRENEQLKKNNDNLQILLKKINEEKILLQKEKHEFNLLKIKLVDRIKFSEEKIVSLQKGREINTSTGSDEGGFEAKYLFVANQYRELSEKCSILEKIEEEAKNKIIRMKDELNKLLLRNNSLTRDLEELRKNVSFCEQGGNSEELQISLRKSTEENRQLKDRYDTLEKEKAEMLERSIKLETEMKENLKKIKSMLHEKMEENNQIKVEKEDVFLHKNYFTLSETLRLAHKCSHCEKILEEPQICANSCCKKYCKNCSKENNTCPSNTCRSETLFPDELTNNLLGKIKIVCSLCDEEMERSLFESHFSEHIFECDASNLGCTFKGDKSSLSEHFFSCTYLQKSKLEKQSKLISSLFEGLQLLIQF